MDTHRLPFLPGNSFRDITKPFFHRSQTLVFKNGYSLPRRPSTGIGKTALLSDQLTQNQMNELSREVVSITYGSSRNQYNIPNFIPAHVALDKKVLRFHAYFTQEVLDSPNEKWRVRHVTIYYYLEDDSMCISEPPVENSGIPQGMVIKRHRLPKNELGESYHWKDLNLGMDLLVYGVIYHLTHCDAFTKDFMESEGIFLNDPEPTPVDLYITRRIHTQIKPSFTTPSNFDQLNQFLTMDRKVLRFFALWDDSDFLHRERRPVSIQYYLVDNTVEVRELHEPNNGRDPFPVMMRRQRLPKQIKPAIETFPSCVLEFSKQEVDKYYSPKDFLVGETVKLLGRPFLLYDCDGFTKDYYQKNYPDMVLKPKEGPKNSDMSQEKKWEIPPYNGFGSLEDSLRNCLSLIPEPPKKGVKNKMENDNKALRFAAVLETRNPQDEDRRFILSYSLADDMVSIYEKPTTGIIGGKFLEKTRVPKPSSTVDKPVFYTPADFAIGATVEVFSHRFVLTDADRSVLTYLESIADQIPSQTVDSLRQRLSVHPDQGVTNSLSVDQNENNEVEESS